MVNKFVSRGLVVACITATISTSGVLAQGAFVDATVLDTLRSGSTTRVIVIPREVATATPPGASRQSTGNTSAPARGTTVDALTQILRTEAPIVRPMGANGMLSATLTARGVEILRNRDDIAAIIEDVQLRRAMFDTHPLVQVSNIQRAGLTGRGATVAVIDDGIDGTHPFLASAIVGEACFSSNDARAGFASLCADRRDTVEGPGAAQNCTADVDCFHGTHVSGIVAGRGAQAPGGQSFNGVAPAAGIYAIKVASRLTAVDCSRTPSDCATMATSDVIRALEHVATVARRHNIVAVNLSLGSSRVFPFHCDRSGDPLSARYGQIIDRLTSMGIAVIAAAGNSQRIAGVGQPACLSNVTAVGSIERDLQVSRFSDTGIKVDLLAPGGRILSSWPGGTYRAINGTSMAAPYIAGMIALMRERFPANVVPPQSLIEALRRTGQMIRDPRNDLHFPIAQLERAMLALIDTQRAAEEANRPSPRTGNASAPAAASEHRPQPTPQSGPPAAAATPPAPAQAAPPAAPTSLDILRSAPPSGGASVPR